MPSVRWHESNLTSNNKYWKKYGKEKTLEKLRLTKASNTTENGDHLVELGRLVAPPPLLPLPLLPLLRVLRRPPSFHLLPLTLPLSLFRRRCCPTVVLLLCSLDLAVCVTVWCKLSASSVWALVGFGVLLGAWRWWKGG